MVPRSPRHDQGIDRDHGRRRRGDRTSGPAGPRLAASRSHPRGRVVLRPGGRADLLGRRPGERRARRLVRVRTEEASRTRSSSARRWRASCSSPSPPGSSGSHAPSGSRPSAAKSPRRRRSRRTSTASRNSPRHSACRSSDHPASPRDAAPRRERDSHEPPAIRARADRPGAHDPRGRPQRRRRERLDGLLRHRSRPDAPQPAAQHRHRTHP